MIFSTELSLARNSKTKWSLAKRSSLRMIPEFFAPDTLGFACATLERSDRPRRELDRRLLEPPPPRDAGAFTFAAAPGVPSNSMRSILEIALTRCRNRMRERRLIITNSSVRRGTSCGLGRVPVPEYRSNPNANGCVDVGNSVPAFWLSRTSCLRAASKTFLNFEGLRS